MKYWNTTGCLKQLAEWQPNCWTQVTCPTDDDFHELEERFGIPDYFLTDISDTDERARYEYDDGWMLIILRIPHPVHHHPARNNPQAGRDDNGVLLRDEHDD